MAWNSAAAVALALAAAALVAALPGAPVETWTRAVLAADGTVHVGSGPAPGPQPDDFYACSDFAPLVAACDTGQHSTPFSLTLGWPSCKGPVNAPLSNCFSGDMLDVLSYQDAEHHQLVFKCSVTFYTGTGGEKGGQKIYDYACFPPFGPFLFDVPFEHTCAMRAYGTTFAGGAPVEAYPRDGAPGAVGAWYCAVGTFAGWS